MEFHPVANVFPLMTGVEFDALVSDIDVNGQIQPIFTYQGKIIDGRNRYRACERLNIVPACIPYEGDESELVAFVVSLNLKRRHLSDSQRGMIAAKVANLENGQKASFANLQSRAVTQSEAAELLNVSPRTVADAKAVQTHGAPELIQAVEKGEVAVSTAAVLAKELPVEKQSEVVQLAADVKEAVCEEAKQILEARKAHEAAIKNDPNHKWSDIITDLQTRLNAIRNNGGVLQMTKQWTPDQRVHFLGRLRNFEQLLRNVITDLETAL